MAKRGRPSIYSDAVATTICERIANGESLRSICSEPSMPAMMTVMDWAADKEDFRIRYARAREAQAEFMDGAILEAAENADADPQAARVKIDAYKWRAAKLAPKKYGDATTIKHADADGEKIEMDDVSRAARLAALAREINAQLGDESNAAD